MLKPIDNAKVKTKIQHKKNERKSNVFSYDKGIKKSQCSTLSTKKNCDGIRKHQDKDAFSEHKMK